jgi:hypothetical protein
MGSAFLFIILGSFAPVVALICWSQQRDFEYSYMQRKTQPVTPTD